MVFPDFHVYTNTCVRLWSIYKSNDNSFRRNPIKPTIIICSVVFLSERYSIYLDHIDIALVHQNSFYCLFYLCATRSCEYIIFLCVKIYVLAYKYSHKRTLLNNITHTVVCFLWDN